MIARDTLLDNRYRVIELLGAGAMGSVYLALDERLSCNVAVKGTIFKRFRLEPEREAELRRAFEREAKLLANLQHETIPRVGDYFFAGDEQFLVMEFISGEDLFEQAEKKRRKNETFDVATIADWTLQLLDALNYLHSQPEPVIHKDIKLSNLKVTARSKIKLLDFGISKGYAGEMTRVEAGSLQMGTEEYAPLEQFLKFPSKAAQTLQQALSIKHADKVEAVLQQTTDARSDLYSLAVTVYRLLTGKPPADYLPRALAIWEGKPDPLVSVHELNQTVPKDVSNVLMRSLALEKEARFQSAAEMRAAFQAAWQEHLRAIEKERYETELKQRLSREYEEHLALEIARRESAEDALAARDRELAGITRRLQEITTTTGLQSLNAATPERLSNMANAQTQNSPTNSASNEDSTLSKLFKRKYLGLILLGLIAVSGIAFTWGWSGKEAATNSNTKSGDVHLSGGLDDRLERGKAFLQSKNYDGAINEFSAAITSDPTSIEALVNRGEAFRKKGEFDRALEDYSAAVEVDPKNLFALANRADVYCQQKKDYERAFVDFNHVLEQNIESDFLYEKRGYCYEVQKKFDEALSDYNKALILDPDEAWTYFRRGVIHLLRQKNNEALADFNEVVQRTPADWTAYSNRAIAYARLGKSKLSKEDLNKSEELKKQSANQ